jgi:hypothetical protein
MLDMHALTFAATSEKELRQQIDRSVSRALVDDDYAQLLLADPTVAVDGHGCAPQHYKKLMQIKASSLVDFATQAQALFWVVEPTPSLLWRPNFDWRRLRANSSERG